MLHIYITPLKSSSLIGLCIRSGLHRRVVHQESSYPSVLPDTLSFLQALRVRGRTTSCWHWQARRMTHAVVGHLYEQGSVQPYPVVPTCRGPPQPLTVIARIKSTCHNPDMIISNMFSYIELVLTRACLAYSYSGFCSSLVLLRPARAYSCLVLLDPAQSCSGLLQLGSALSRSIRHVACKFYPPTLAPQVS